MKMGTMQRAKPPSMKIAVSSEINKASMNGLNPANKSFKSVRPSSIRRLTTRKKPAKTGPVTTKALKFINASPIRATRMKFPTSSLKSLHPIPIHRPGVTLTLAAIFLLLGGHILKVHNFPMSLGFGLLKIQFWFHARATTQKLNLSRSDPKDGTAGITDFRSWEFRLRLGSEKRCTRD